MRSIHSTIGGLIAGEGRGASSPAFSTFTNLPPPTVRHHHQPIPPPYALRVPQLYVSFRDYDGGWCSQFAERRKTIEACTEAEHGETYRSSSFNTGTALRPQLDPTTFQYDVAVSVLIRIPHPDVFLRGRSYAASNRLMSTSSRTACPNHSVPMLGKMNHCIFCGYRTASWLRARVAPTY